MTDDRDTLSGILPLHKASGITSTRALSAAKRRLQIKKAGHGGTLDPLASGVLVLLFGEATRYASHLLGGSKRYLATVQFGATSDTDDAEGTFTPVAAPPPPPQLRARVAALLPEFCGEISQTAPLYSALKHQGKPLYAYARRRAATQEDMQENPAEDELENLPIKTRRVHIHALSLLAAEGSRVSLAVTCGGGVYIRALARDLGAALGCGAYLSALQRTHCGGFSLQQALTLEQLDAQPPAVCRDHLLPIDSVLGDLPAITLTAHQVRQLGSGVGVKMHRRTHGDPVRVLSGGGRFAGLAEHRDGCYRPLRFLHWTRTAAPLPA